jgi:hypothetical protein
MTREEAMLSARDFLRTFAPPLKRNAAVSAGLLGAVANIAAAASTAKAAAATSSSGIGGSGERQRPCPCSSTSQPAAKRGRHVGAMGGFWVAVKSLTSMCLHIEELTSSTTVEALQEAIRLAIGIPPEQQRLVFQGRLLEAARTLGDYSISAGAELHLVLPLRAC